jgi:hypothetical protein
VSNVVPDAGGGFLKTHAYYNLANPAFGGCSALLSALQELPLQKMAATKYIDADQLGKLRAMGNSLDPDHVIFYEAVAMKYLHWIPDPRAGSTIRFLDHPKSASLGTEGTLWQIRAHKIPPDGKMMDLPWQRDPNFRGKGIHPEAKLAFEIGRMAAIEKGATQDLTFAAVLSMLGEAETLRIPLDQVYIYDHALSAAHIRTYQMGFGLKPYHAFSETDVVQFTTLADLLKKMPLEKFFPRIGKVIAASGGKLTPLEVKRMVELTKTVMDQRLVHRSANGSRVSSAPILLTRGRAWAARLIIPKIRREFPQYSEDFLMRALSALEGEFARGEFVNPDWVKDLAIWTPFDQANDLKVMIGNLDGRVAEKDPKYLADLLPSISAHYFSQTQALAPWSVPDLIREGGLVIETASQSIVAQARSLGARIETVVRPAAEHTTTTVRAHAAVTVYRLHFTGIELKSYLPTGAAQKEAYLRLAPGKEETQTRIEYFTQDW